MNGYKIVSESLIQNCILYHISPYSNLESIKKYGLDPSKLIKNYKRGLWRTLVDGIYLSSNKEYLINDISKQFKESKYILITCIVPLTDLLSDEDTFRWRGSNILRTSFNPQIKTQDQIRKSLDFMEYVKKIYHNPNHDNTLQKFTKEYDNFFSIDQIKEMIKSVCIYLMLQFWRDDSNVSTNELLLQRKILNNLVKSSNRYAIQVAKKVSNNKKLSATFVVMKKISFKELPKIEKIEIGNK